jgi:hypothetical protein
LGTLFTLLQFLFAATLLTGCATAPSSAGHPHRPFSFDRDTFSYANELVWEYRFDERGKWTSHPREPKPDYTHRCFVVARSAEQFFQHARFDPNRPKADADTYRKLIHLVISTSPREELAEARKIVIPGYADLREFSAEQGALLKAECGGAWQSYFQRGHWRMIWPFTRHHQEKTAGELAVQIKGNRPTLVHLVRFPSLKINHAVILFAAVETDSTIEYSVYDPNAPDRPAVLTYDRATRTFRFPVNFYFPGGRVDVYEIYRGFCY